MTDSRRERKKQETRQRLLEVAWELFRQKGYEQTTVEDITEAADVAKGTFFNYFAAKEQVLGAIAAWRIDLVGSRALAATDVPEGSVARIKVVMKAMADEFGPDGELARHFFVARIGAPMRHKSAHHLGHFLLDLVVQGQRNGEIRDDLPPELVTRLLLTCLFYNLIRWCNDPAGGPLAEQVLYAVDALLEGLGSEHSGEECEK